MSTKARKAIKYIAGILLCFTVSVCIWVLVQHQEASSANDLLRSLITT